MKGKYTGFMLPSCRGECAVVVLIVYEGVFGFLSRARKTFLDCSMSDSIMRLAGVMFLSGRVSGAGLAGRKRVDSVDIIRPAGLAKIAPCFPTLGIHGFPQHRDA